jgi:hypothetical protein
MKPTLTNPTPLELLHTRLHSLFSAPAGPNGVEDIFPAAIIGHIKKNDVSEADINTATELTAACANLFVEGVGPSDPPPEFELLMAHLTRVCGMTSSIELLDEYIL